MNIPFTRLAVAAIVAGMLGQIALADTGNLPDLGDESASVISPMQERKLGEEFMRSARTQLDIVDDAELSAYIQSVDDRLTAKGPAAGQQFHLFLINDPSINAFAVPGGYIGVHTGLILATENESELASVIAHETAHITQRHIPRMMAEAKRTSGPAMIALLAAILLASSGHQGGEAAIAMSSAAIAQKELNFSREFEQEADRIGMTVLTAGGYDARAMPAFFERMQSYSRLYESNLPEFLRTHPITTRRIAETRDQAERYPRAPEPDNTDFYHAQAKIRALSSERPAEAVDGFKNSLANGHYANEDAERYGYTLALLYAGHYDEARNEISRLIEHHPNYALYRIAQAEIALATGRYAETLKLYAAAIKSFPNNSALSQRYAAALLRTDHPGEARDQLKKTIRQRPDDPVLQKMLATAAGDSGSYIEAHQALAEYYYLNGNTNGAIQQLQIARRYAGDNFYYQSSLDARIREIREEAALYKPR
jgi:predicted Zn-dependent protease